MKEVLKRLGSPEAITTDGLRNYKAAMSELGNAGKQEIGRWANNRVENSNLLFRRAVSHANVAKATSRRSAFARLAPKPAGPLTAQSRTLPGLTTNGRMWSAQFATSLSLRPPSA